MVLFCHNSTTIREEIFADFEVFAKKREIKFPRKFKKSAIREIFEYREPRNFSNFIDREAGNFKKIKKIGEPRN